jgi:hypothetical protein
MDNWTSIEDGLPPNKEKVMVKTADGLEAIGHLAYKGWYLRTRDYWCVYSPSIKDSDVTHWRAIEND